MPSGIYVRSDIARFNISQSKIGIKQSKETKEKRRLSMLGKNTWAYGNKNNLGKHWKILKDSWNKGKPWTKARIEAEVKRKGYFKKPIVKNGNEYDIEWYKIRKDIYKRDNYTCQECGIKCVGTNGKSYKKIQCHHIDYNTKINNKNNLITLCVSCHMKTNFKRKDWINYFKNKKKE